MDTLRLQQLSGLHPHRAVLEQLKADRERSIVVYDQLIKKVEQGLQLDEGLFTSLKAKLATVGQLGAAGVKKTIDTSKDVTDDVKKIYLDDKSKIELELLIKSVKTVITDFEVIEKDAITIIKGDPEISKEMELFATLLNKLLDTLSTRMMLTKSESPTP